MSCPSGSEGAGRKRTPAMGQRAALLPYASRMVGADVPITSVQKLMGHNSIHTTQLYVHVADSKVEKDYHAAVLRITKGSLPGKEVAP
jgi:site-specific recombinase XerC